MSPQGPSAKCLLLAKQLLSTMHPKQKLPAFVTEQQCLMLCVHIQLDATARLLTVHNNTFMQTGS